MKKITLNKRLTNVRLEGANNRLSAFRRTMMNHYSLRLSSPMIDPDTYSRTCYFLYGTETVPDDVSFLEDWVEPESRSDPLCLQMKQDIRNLKDLWGHHDGRR